MQKLRHILFFIVFSSSTTILAEDDLYILDETHLSIGFSGRPCWLCANSWNVYQS